MRHIRYTIGMAIGALLCWGCAAEDVSGDQTAQQSGTQHPASTQHPAGIITLAANEQNWQGETVGITRSGETLEGLKAAHNPAQNGDGFGLYCSRIAFSNKQVTWDAANGRWAYGTSEIPVMLWPDNVVKYSVSFNGEMKESKAGKFALSGTETYSDCSECTYQGVTFTKCLSLDAGNTISWTSGATGGNTTKVTIVQSADKSNTILFDGASLSLASAKNITGGRVYTIKNVEGGSHTITRGSGETGILFVSVDMDFTAYAPYESGTPTKLKGITSVSSTSLTFKPAIQNTIDLLWAEDEVTTDGTIHLNFKHALGKLAVGSVTNNYGQPITLKEVKFTGKQYTEGELSLINGEWSGLPTPVDAVKEFNDNESSEPTLSTILGGSTTIPNGASIAFPANFYYMQIPGPTITVSFTFHSDSYGDEEVSKDIVLEEGVMKTVNLTIGMNHEVEIQ